MVKGDIYTGAKLGHPFIFYKNMDDHGDQFLACMVTHSGRYHENIPMRQEHFKVLDDNGQIYKFQFEKDTHLTCRKLIKKSDYGTFEQCGKLTPDGISFVEMHIETLHEEEFKTVKDKY